jgi:hypothetical protein
MCQCPGTQAARVSGLAAVAGDQVETSTVFFPFFVTVRRSCATWAATCEMTGQQVGERADAFRSAMTCSTMAWSRCWPADWSVSNGESGRTAWWR